MLTGFTREQIRWLHRYTKRQNQGVGGGATITGSYHLRPALCQTLPMQTPILPSQERGVAGLMSQIRELGLGGISELAPVWVGDGERGPRPRWSALARRGVGRSSVRRTWDLGLPGHSPHPSLQLLCDALPSFIPRNTEGRGGGSFPFYRGVHRGSESGCAQLCKPQPGRSRSWIQTV